MDRPRGYYTSQNYIGYLPGNTKMPFATEEEYMEYYNDLEDNTER